ncbi:cell division protein ZapC [Xenorhabdus hominickii]|uniref:Cell division protein ZapC n=1 Tax=Xenorhabdus hominickii TaxID=351679 RepID=A0A2G0QAY5_XENHO|nr:cell division protein ZapC [Xenorhabdus hominickii]AOM40656.1 cell division protein ZapC [Xenorhabdus hominickii]PHM56394.1 cell division protein ZapC [Xenorhabdus hominickii]
MKIKPDDQWRWYFDPEHNRVMLDLANGMVFRSRFPAKMLTDYAITMQGMSFSVDDAALYYAFEEHSRHVNMAPALSAELALNGVVAFRFMKPQMPKSWYFSNFALVQKPEQGEIVQLRLQDNSTGALFMVTEVGDNASQCLLAQQKLELSDRVMTFCDPIKVMNDRIAPYIQRTQTSIFDRAM